MASIQNRGWWQFLNDIVVCKKLRLKFIPNHFWLPVTIISVDISIFLGTDDKYASVTQRAVIWISLVQRSLFHQFFRHLTIFSSTFSRPISICRRYSIELLRYSVHSQCYLLHVNLVAESVMNSMISTILSTKSIGIYSK